MIKCIICNEEFPTNRQLSWHIKHHNLNNKEYYDLYLKKENDGICLTCGKPTNFISMNKGYRKHCNKKCLNEDKDVQLKRLNTNLDKYGYKTSFSTKETQDKVKQTIKEKYDVTNPFQSEQIKEKIKQNNIKKYGVENPQQRPDVQEKTKNTCLERYGTEYAIKSDEIQNKIKQTCINKYGVENVFASDYGKQKIKETCLQKYGCENPQQNREIQIKTLSHYKYNDINFDSSWELAVYIYCIDYNIYIEREPIRLEYINSKGKKSYYFPDFMINNQIIEIKGPQFLDENGNLKNKEKQQCMKENNVFLWTIKDVQPYLDYCINKYQDKYWYKQYKIHK